ncbi:MAG: hypothetical protein NVS3B12_08670 [Acidimicrobiales bacterium]
MRGPGLPRRRFEVTLVDVNGSQDRLGAREGLGQVERSFERAVGDAMAVDEREEVVGRIGLVLRGDSRTAYSSPSMIRRESMVRAFQ